jgi:hypothetical protein
MTPIILLKLGALAHLGLIAAGLLMPARTRLWAHLAGLPPFIRNLFRVYYLFIGLCLVSFGAASWLLADELASGTLLARAVNGFLTAFWTLRLIAAVWLLDVRPYLTNAWLRVGYQATNVVFAALPLLYAWLALRA